VQVPAHSSRLWRITTAAMVNSWMRSRQYLDQMRSNFRTGLTAVVLGSNRWRSVDVAHRWPATEYRSGT
jgi:hypothetical protein